MFVILTSFVEVLSYFLGRLWVIRYWGLSERRSDKSKMLIAILTGILADARSIPE